jgi:hypothetical protein
MSGGLAACSTRRRWCVADHTAAATNPLGFAFLAAEPIYAGCPKSGGNRSGHGAIFWLMVPKSEAAEFRAELDVSIARAAVDTSDFGTLSNYLAQNWLAFLLDRSVAVLTWSGSGGLRV